MQAAAAERQAMVQTKLSTAEWTKVVGVAGVGTVLEW